MTSTFLPGKSRRVRFQLTLTFHDLNNVPLVSGTSFIKWHLPHSTSAEHRGRTYKCPIKDHRVNYGYTKSVPVSLKIRKSGHLQECQIDLEVLQEYSQGGRGERIVLGNVGLNLGEYVNGDGSEDSSKAPPAAGGQGQAGQGEEGHTITRRYLMRDSKINSTLKISISMKYIDGPRDFIAPALKSAPVFGGIAGIMSSATPAAASLSQPAGLKAKLGQRRVRQSVSGADSDEEITPYPTEAVPPPPEPNFSASSRETGELQDMYRRTLAAYWSSQPGEMRADECIEDIFSGGDGWGKKGRPSQGGTTAGGNGNGSGHGHGHGGGGQGRSPTQAESGSSTPNNAEANGGGGSGESGGGQQQQQSWGKGDIPGVLRGPAGGTNRDLPSSTHTHLGHHGHHSHHHHGGGHQRQSSMGGRFPNGGRGVEHALTERKRREGVAGHLDEMEVREHLGSWQISEKAYS